MRNDVKDFHQLRSLILAVPNTSAPLLVPIASKVASELVSVQHIYKGRYMLRYKGTH